jgi:rhodanese-related sulfurtransferase
MNSLKALLVALACFAGGALALAVPPEELRRLLDEDQPVTVIDVRPPGLFQRGHIPGAINVPAALVPERKLPRLGRVIVCGEGLGRDDVAPAVEALNRKPGIKAEALDGGFAAWESAGGLSTRPPGLTQEEIFYITYDQLKKSQRDAVLVDLRAQAPAGRMATQGAFQHAEPQPQAQAFQSKPLTDLSSEFPLARVTKSPFQSKTGIATLANPGQGERPLLVLIDSGDGSAQQTARALRANGVKRVVILAGGEEILQRGGRPGLQRASGRFEDQ